MRLIVPYAAGGANDTIARLIQPHLEKALGQPVIVDNRPAASGIVGTDAVAKARLTDTTLRARVHDLHRQPGRQPEASLRHREGSRADHHDRQEPAPVHRQRESAGKQPRRVHHARQGEPGKFNYATPGATSQAHLLVAWWSGLAGMQMQHLPYRGGAPAVLGTVTGDAQLTVMSPMASMPQIEAGTLRPIAIGSLQRDPSFPNLPTVAEQGFPGFEAVAWCGLFTTAGTPKEIVASSMRRSIASSAIRRLPRSSRSRTSRPPAAARRNSERSCPLKSAAGARPPRRRRSSSDGGRRSGGGA